MRKSNWAKLKWPRVKETASPAPLWLFCDPFCKSRAQSTCEGELIQKKTQVATIFQCTEAHQTFRSRLWVLTKLVSVSETNPNKKTDTETSNACLGNWRLLWFCSLRNWGETPPNCGGLSCGGENMFLLLKWWFMSMWSSPLSAGSSSPSFLFSCWRLSSWHSPCKTLLSSSAPPGWSPPSQVPRLT